MRRDGLRGWINAPKTRSLKLKNVSKAFTALKGWINVEQGVAMSCRWLFAGVEDQFVDGNWAVVIGLLEDIFRCVDGMPPRSVQQRYVETPYFGKYAAVYKNHYDDLLLLKDCTCEEKKSEKGDAAVFEQDLGGGNDIVPLLRIDAVREVNEGEIIPSDLTRAGGLGFSRRLAKSGAEGPTAGPLEQGNDLGPGVVEPLRKEPAGEEDQKVKFVEEEKQAVVNERPEGRVEQISIGQQTLPGKGEPATTIHTSKTNDEPDRADTEPVVLAVEEVEREDEPAKELVVAAPVESPFREPTRADVYALKKWLGSKVSFRSYMPT